MLSNWNRALMIKLMITLKNRLYEKNVVGFFCFSPEIPASVSIFKIQIFYLHCADV